MAMVMVVLMNVFICRAAIGAHDSVFIFPVLAVLFSIPSATLDRVT